MQTLGLVFRRLLVVVLVLGQMTGARSDAGTNAPGGEVGQKIANISFQDLRGNTVSLHDLEGKKATVVVFLSFECPVSKSYAQPLTELAQAYPDLSFVGLSSSEDESAAQIAEQAREFKLPFPIFKDRRQTAADAFAAKTTPEAFLLDRDGVLRYRGRIDDLYVARRRTKNLVSRHDLRQAIDELLGGKAISVPQTQSVGCPIVRNKETKTVQAEVTYYRDVLPIVQNNCQVCHRPNEVGPFSLMTYRQAVKWGPDIKEFTHNRQMPPWKPAGGVAFHNERKLSDQEIATLAAWVDGGMPAGDPKDAPPAKPFTDGWQLGEPDLVLSVSEDFTLGALGKDHFHCFVLPTNQTEDKYVVAVETKPGNPRIVHHTLLAIDTSGQGRKLEQQEQEKAQKEPTGDFGPGYPVAMGFGFITQGGLSGWAPGQMARFLPEGTGYFLPKGSDVVMQVHYHRNGRVEKDRTAIGLYFARRPVEKRFQSLILAGGQRNLLGRPGFFSIPAGEENFRLSGSMWVDQDCTIYNVLPHMHKLGKAIKATITPPEGPTKTLIAINEWDYNWQETYVFKDPIPVKAGTRFEVEAYYDNSANNPNNPNDPPKRVNFGQQTTDEMCFVFLGATADKPGRLRPRFVPPKTETTSKP